MAREDTGRAARKHCSNPDKIRWCLVLGASVVGGEWSGLGFIIKVELTRFAKEFDMLHGKK